ncbi:MAG: aminoacetone oxidase family FAD-binding enzyme [Campylobacteraceae bacterium]|nr:aminoacetone oxidase family FAD-binding enzyme [Campylobacteraceae bacterium]
MSEFKTIILGGGASGLFLAANLKDATILEQNSSLGKKIIASGGGKCNITNARISTDNYLGDSKFVFEILSNLNYKEVLEFFSPLKFHKIKNHQYFCKTNSKDVLNHLARKVKNAYLNTEVLDVSKSGDKFEIITSKGKFKAENLVVATGGLSCPSLGVSDIGYKIGAKFGHEVTTLNPALTGFTVQKEEFWFKELSGVSLNASLKAGERSLDGDLLFTHKGISGPLIFNASLFWEKGRMSLNFLPNFNLEKIKQSKKQLASELSLPKSFIKAFLNSQNLEDKQIYKFSKDEFEIIKKLQNYDFAPAGNFGYSRAEITKGGVKTEFIDSNCMSTMQPNLYFIGEVLDVSGMLGGYNIHFAFASAKAALKNLI